ncbi:MAG: FIG00512493: hypothetical protein, partial [uncultured Thermomicrobiales bacterium]
VRIVARRSHPGSPRHSVPPIGPGNGAASWSLGRQPATHPGRPRHPGPGHPLRRRHLRRPVGDHWRPGLAEAGQVRRLDRHLQPDPGLVPLLRPGAPAAGRRRCLGHRARLRPRDGRHRRPGRARHDEPLQRRDGSRRGPLLDHGRRDPGGLAARHRHRRPPAPPADSPRVARLGAAARHPRRRRRDGPRAADGRRSPGPRGRRRRRRPRVAGRQLEHRGRGPPGRPLRRAPRDAGAAAARPGAGAVRPAVAARGAADRPRRRRRAGVDRAGAAADLAGAARPVDRQPGRGHPRRVRRVGRRRGRRRRGGRPARRSRGRRRGCPV